jgi:hypothetical protein
MAVTQTAEGGIVSFFSARPLANRFCRRRTELVAAVRCRFEKAASKEHPLG